MTWWQKVLFFAPDVILLSMCSVFFWEIIALLYDSWKHRVQMEALEDYQRMREFYFRKIQMEKESKDGKKIV